MLRAALPLSIFVVLLGFLYVGLGLDPNAKETTLIDEPVPTFKLPLVEKPTEVMSEQIFQNQVTLFNAWASWCIACRQEHPLLMQLAEKTDIPIYGLNYKDTIDAAQRTLDRQGNPYLASGFDMDGRTGMDWGIIGTPETFIVDQQGVIRYKHIGPLTPSVMQQKIFPLIKQLRQPQKADSNRKLDS